MPNHFHWMVYVREEGCKVTLERSDDLESSDRSKARRDKQPMVQGIATLLSSYTRAIKKQNGWSGSLFRSKTKAVVLEEDINHIYHNQPAHLENCFHYIHENPVSAGMVQRSTDWKYSSALDYYGQRKGTLCNLSLAKEWGLV